MIITIDGPTASGKSTLARMLAKKFGYYYLYSGLLYRAVAYYLITNYGYNEQSIVHPEQQQVQEAIAHLHYHYSSEHGEQILLDGKDITKHLKDASMDQPASLVSTNQYVRNQIDAWQHAIADDHNIVADGRDMGTVVFPQAQYKFFLTARPQVRAERWREQQKKLGNQCSFDDALQFITKRDERDCKRHLAPLRVADNGIVIDNSDYSSQQTFDELLKKIA